MSSQGSSDTPSVETPEGRRLSMAQQPTAKRAHNLARAVHAKKKPTMDVLRLSFPKRSAELESLLTEVRERRHPLRTARIHLRWTHIDDNGPGNSDPEMAPGVHRILDQVARAPELERVAIRISQSAKSRIWTRSSEAITTILNKFPNKVESLYLEGAILLGDFERFLAALMAQRRMETLHFERISPLPNHAARQLPALILAVSTLPIVRNCHLSSALRVAIPQETMVNSLVRLAERPALTLLDLRNVGLPQENCQFLPPLIQALHQRPSTLQHLILGSAPQATHEEDCLVLQAVGAMLQVNVSLRTLLLHVASETHLLEAMAPIVDALQTNRTLESITFVRRDNNTPLEIPDTFGQIFQQDNVTLRYLHIYDAKRVERKPTTTRVLLPALPEFCLKLNRLGRRLLVDRPQESTWIRLISALRDHTDVVYYYLRQNPDLVNPDRSGPAMVLKDRLEPSRKRRRILPNGQSAHNLKFCRMLAKQCR